MIVLPAIPAIVAAVTPIVEAILVAAGIGALFGGATGAVGEVVTGVQEHGSINRAVVESAVHGAAQGAAEGALVGGAFGVVGFVVAPIVPVVGGALQPVIGAADDVARPAIGAIDDAVRPVIAAVDDAVRPVLNKVGDAAKSVGGGVCSVFNRARNALNARFFNRLPKGAGIKGYVYVMDDVSTAGRYKIGKTIEPARRLPEVEKKLGSKVNYSCIISTDVMSRLENDLHTKFAGQRLPDFGAGTEFFKLNSAQVKAACSR